MSYNLDSTREYVETADRMIAGHRAMARKCLDLLSVHPVFLTVARQELRSSVMWKAGKKEMIESDARFGGAR